jgi:hypothetical protein
MMQAKKYDVNDYESSDDEGIQAENRALKKNNENTNNHNRGIIDEFDYNCRELNKTKKELCRTKNKLDFNRFEMQG